MNNLSMIGNIGKEPEVINTSGGFTIATVTLAVQRPFKDKQTNEYVSDWFNCKAFGKTAELIEEHFHKGDKLAFNGRVQNNNYTKDDGTKVYRDEIIIDSFTFVESKAKRQDNAAPKKQSKPVDEEPLERNNDTIDISDDDLPF